MNISKKITLLTVLGITSLCAFGARQFFIQVNEGAVAASIKAEEVNQPVAISLDKETGDSVQEKESEKTKITDSDSSKKQSLPLEQELASSAIQFPQDHNAHPSFLGEWWYINLLTKTTDVDGQDEKRLGHLISFSRIGNRNGLLSSRYDLESKSFKERTDTDGSLAVSLRDSKFLVAVYSHDQTNMTLEEIDSSFDRRRTYYLTGKTPEIGKFALTLKERRAPLSGFSEPLRWGGATPNCTGLISVFAPNDTFYYSIPNLEVSGTITDTDGKKRIIRGGKAWIDHQWFNSTPPSSWKGHYWSSMHLTSDSNFYNGNGRHVAFGFVTQIYGSGPKYSYWVKRNLDGTNECGTIGTAQTNTYWGTGYPKSWSLSFVGASSASTTVTGNAHSNNQLYMPPFGPIFFEPVSSYTVPIDGQNFSGWGFFETHLKR